MYLQQLRKKIVDEINLSKLDIDMVYFVMKDIMNEITILYNKEVLSQQEKQKIEEEKKEEKK